MSWNNFKAPNLGLLVYKRLYSETSILNYVRVHEDKLEINIPKDARTTPFDLYYRYIYDKTLEDYYQIENPLATQKFTLITTYPGLLLGTGYTHDSNAKGDIKIGFYFDHTTGQPVIPGSTVKGVIKSVFENEDNITDKDSVHNIRFFIEEIIQECENDEKSEWEQLLKIITDENIEILKKLKEDIFGNQDSEGKNIFFDSVIDFEKTDTNKKFLSNDFITPHQPNLLKNPTPLMFLKVLPSIAFQFRFLLSDTEIKSKENSNIVLNFTAKNKEQFFKKILLTIGIGAKTNVGYGQFTESKYIESKSINNEKAVINTNDVVKKITKFEIKKNLNNIFLENHKAKNEFHPKAIEYLKKNQNFTGLVTDILNGYYQIHFKVKEYECIYYKKQDDKLYFHINENVKVICSNDYNKDNANISIRKL